MKDPREIDPFALSATAAEPLTGAASPPLSFLLLGATGRTGLPFLSQALARGHFVTVYVRNLSKLPAVVASHPRLRAFTGELHEADKIALAIRAAKPDVIYVMLASEAAPYTAVSTGTHNALLGLRAMRAAAAVEPGATPFISIAAWGLGPPGHTSPALRACSSASRRRCSGRSPWPISRSSWRRWSRRRTRASSGRPSSCRRYSTTARRRILIGRARRA